ncbi:MAG: hypothetical protein ABMA13_23005, partial [Chthoniobacteraceae bacterium]
MPAYGFKGQFAAKVELGEKRQTIRQPWRDGRRPRVGQTAHCFAMMRSPSCRRLARGKIVAVDKIAIELHKARLRVLVEDRVLKADEVEQLAR